MIINRMYKPDKYHNSTRIPWYKWNLLQPELLYLSRSLKRPNTSSLPITTILSLAPSVSRVAIWVYQGKVQVSQGSSSCTATAGEWIFIPEGRPAQMTHTAQSEWILLAFALRWNGAGRIFCSDDSLWKSPRITRLEEQTILMVHRFADKIFQQYRFQWNPTNAATWFDLRRLFDRWIYIWIQESSQFGRKWRHSQNMDLRILKAIRRLEETSPNTRPDMQTIAADIGLSKSHFYRLFRHETATSPWRYWKNGTTSHT